ncbi:MAG: Mov34/MPN/PAD-1 family protein [SAR324 cluster bacterium]|nr:Mov34/MPN/PAD-1 family protein [SAR324 cluster bacterium]
MISIPKELLQRCYAHGAEAYPEEACGVLSALEDDPQRLTGFHPIANTLGKLHEQDPKRYPRTPHEGYVLDPLSFAKLERSLQDQGERIRIIYHSHIDVGAYFSEEDKKQATWDGNPILPGMFYLVCGIKARKPDGAILAAFNENTRDFDEEKVD